MFLYLVLFTLLRGSVSQECGTAIRANSSLHFPWIAEMFSTTKRTQSRSDKRLCGSTIITSSFAITAAHCFQEKGIETIRAHNEVYLLANVLDLENRDDSHRIDLSSVFIHPKWNSTDSKYESDVALMKFKGTLLFNEKIRPICMWHSGIEGATRGIVISFISLEEDDPGYYNHYRDASRNYAQIFDMPIRAECTKSQPRFAEIATNTTYCAGGLNSGACLETGNSGSSMAVEIEEIFYLRGIVSASFIDFAGCDNFTYTLFTDALKHRDWIERIILDH